MQHTHTNMYADPPPLIINQYAARSGAYKYIFI